MPVITLVEDQMTENQKLWYMQAKDAIQDQNWTEMGLCDEEAEAIALGLMANTNLLQLELDGNGIGERGAKCLAEALENNRTLKTLSLKKNQIGDKGAIALAEALKHGSTLTSLNLNSNMITTTGLMALADCLSVNSQLKELFLDWNHIDCQGARALAKALATNTSLRRLDLEANLIRLDGGIAIAKSLESNSALEVLNLKGNRVGSTGTSAFATALKVNRKLCKLNLSSNDVGSRGAKALGLSLKSNIGLTELSLSDNEIDDEVVKVLKTNLMLYPTLKTLDLTGNPKISTTTAQANANTAQPVIEVESQEDQPQDEQQPQGDQTQTIAVLTSAAVDPQDEQPELDKQDVDNDDDDEEADSDASQPIFDGPPTMARTERAAPLDQAELSAQFFPKQLEVANRLFARIQEVVDLGKFTSFEFVVMVPNLLSLYSQTLERLEKAFPTPAGKVRQSIFRANESPDQKTVFEQFRERVLNVDNQKTLFLFLQDEAHWAATAPVSRMRSQGQAAQEQATGTEATGTEESGGAAGNYLNDADMCAAPNLIQLLVTATPYNLVTRKSRIPEDNVIQWFSESDSNIPANAEHSVYYGIQKFRNYLQDGQDMQQGKFHSRQATEQLLHANPVDSQLYHTWRRGRRDGAESARENGDLYRRHFNHSQIYAQSIRAAAAAASEPPPSGQHRCPDTDQMIKELVSCQNGNDGRSFMILIRVGLVDVGRKLKAELIKARNEAQLQEKFAVLLDVEGKANFLGQLLESGPLDPNYWLTKLRRWNDNDSFVPSTYSDLKGLPCLLILCEKGKMGDTFPSSLRYYDLRLRYSDSRSFVRASLEQDLGRACRYVAERVTDPIPVILIPPKLHRQLKLEEGSNADPFVTLPSADNRVKQLNGFRQHAEQHQALTELLSLSAYRLHCDPADSHYDKGNRSTVRNRFLLYGRPQVGKTGAYLALLRRFEEQLQDDQDVMDCAEDLTDAAEAIDEQPEAKEESIAEATEHPEPMAVDAVEDVEVVQVQPMPPAIAPQSNRGAYPELAVLMGQVGQPGANQLVAPAASTTSTNPQNQVQNGDTAVNVAAASNAFVPNYVARPFDHASTCNDCRMGNLVAGEDLKIPGSSWDDLELHLPTGVDAFAPCTLDPLLQQLRFKPTSSNCKMLLQEFCATLDVKFPIFVDSFQRAHLATLNWRHAMVKDVTDPASIATYLQIVVICREDLGAYRKAWPHLILAVLPEATVPATQNLGFTRYCIQRFAQRCGFEFVWMMDDLLHSFKYRALARETLLQAASRLVLASDAQASEPQPESAQQIHAILQQLFKDNRDRMEAATITAIPAYFALRHLELHPNKDKVAISGFSRPTPRSRARRMQDGFSRQHVYGAVLLNIRLVDESNVWYPKHEAAQADEEFNARCTNSDLLIVMYHRFSFHTKELRSREPVQSQSLPSEHAVTQPHLNQHSGSDAAVQMDVDPPATPSTPIGKMSGTSTSVPTTPNGKAFGNDSAPYTPVKGLVSTTGKRPALDVSTVPDTSKKRRPDSPAIELPTAAESTDSTSLSFLQSLVAKFTRTHGKPAEAATKLVESTNGGHQPVEHETSEPINGDETVTVGDKTIGLTGRQGDRATPEPLPFDEASFVQNLVANLKAREVASAETKSQKEAKAQHRVLPERQVSNGPSSPSSVSNPRSHVLNDLPRPQLVVASPSSSSFRKGAMAETAAEKSTGFARRASSDTEREMVQGPTKRRLDEPDIRPVKRSLLELSDSAMASEASTPVVDATQSFPILATCVLPAGAANIQVQLCDQRFSSIGFKGNEMLMQYSLATLPATPNATSTPTRCEVILDPETMAVKIVLKRS